jgi:hypothetical protein
MGIHAELYRGFRLEVLLPHLAKNPRANKKILLVYIRRSPDTPQSSYSPPSGGGAKVKSLAMIVDDRPIIRQRSAFAISARNKSGVGKIKL